MSSFSTMDKQTLSMKNNVAASSSSTTASSTATTTASSTASSTGIHTPATSELQCCQTRDTGKLSRELEKTLPSQVVTGLGHHHQDQDQDHDLRPVFFFDIDNCLYPRSVNVVEEMKSLIQKYFTENLSLSASDAKALHGTYYKNYGLALDGLIRHHQVDGLEYNAKVDDALPLEKFIRPEPGLRQLLVDLKTAGKCRLWLLTNAYVNHGRRVVKLLGVDDLFEGMTYCDYASSPLICKPKPQMYQKAMADAGFPIPIRTDDLKKCYFVDDGYMNCVSAILFGWENTVHLVDEGEPVPETKACKYVVRNLQELRSVFPHLFEGGK